MSLLDQLSSQSGDRSEESNRAVAEQCLADPSLLQEIARGLASEEAALAGECAEVITMVASERPNLVAAYSQALASLLSHKTTRVRWEAAHALAYIAATAPQAIEPILPQFEAILRQDNSTIVRDYVVEAVGQYAAGGPLAAQKAFPILKEALWAWDGKHAGRALNGLAFVASSASGYKDEILYLARPFLEHEKGVVRKAAKRLIRAIAA